MACSSAHSSGVIVARRRVSPLQSPLTHRWFVVYATGASCDGAVRDARRVGGELAARSEVGWLLFRWLFRDAAFVDARERLGARAGQARV